MKSVFLCFFLVLLAPALFAQQVDNTGWLFLTHTRQLSKKVDALVDIQVRSTDRFIHFETLLLRGAASYNFSKKHSAAIGYANKQDYYEAGKRSTSSEHRLYEQYLFQTDLQKVQLSIRLRQEQRFIREEQQARYQFSQRTRAFVSFQIPLVANIDFSRGLYATIQDELFLNTQYKSRVNNSLFDQHRPFIALGYRWSKQVDTELGYMRWLQKESDGNQQTNVYQLMITTQL